MLKYIVFYCYQSIRKIFNLQAIFITNKITWTLWLTECLETKKATVEACPSGGELLNEETPFADSASMVSMLFVVGNEVSKHLEPRRKQ